MTPSKKIKEYKSARHSPGVLITVSTVRILGTEGIEFMMQTAENSVKLRTVLTI